MATWLITGASSGLGAALDAWADISRTTDFTGADA